MPDVVVIGAGPYGLSIAANLRRRRVPVRVFGRTMEMWTRHMPRGMVLKSDGFATNFGNLPLTLEEFCQRTGRAYAHVGHRTPIDDVIAYARAVQQEYVGEVEDHRVVALDSCRHGFEVTLDNGDVVAAKRVVTATGLMGFQRLPKYAGLFAGKLSHASAHDDLSKFAGQSVIVIGAGQSAFESAALLREQGAAKVVVVCRRPPLWFDPSSEGVRSAWQRARRPNFGMGPGYKAWFWSEAPNLFHHLMPNKAKLAKAYSTFGPAGSGWLKHRVVGVDGIECVVGSIDQDTVAVRDDEVSLEVMAPDASRRTMRADHVIAATGYKPDLRKIAFLQPLLRRHAGEMAWIGDGVPALNRRFETTVPGWHVAGNASAVSFGPSMRFIYGTNRAAPQIAGGLGYSRPVVVQAKAPMAGQTA